MATSTENILESASLSPEGSSSSVSVKMSRKQWKALKKKMKRKERRTAEAKLKEDLSKQNGMEQVESTDSEEERQREKEELERKRQNELWLEKERQAQLEFQAKKDREEKERLRIEEMERKIREEWEERERKEKEEREEKEKIEAEKRSKQEKLLQEARANENKDAWHNPIAPVQYSKERLVEMCPFFKKTGTCRFGEQCSRQHEYPEIGPTIMIPNMFSSFELEQSIVDSHHTDISLEYEDNELYNSFCDFYHDVLPEFKTVGTVIQFKVCCNCEPHLRGNVYVQYKRDTDALEAFKRFNARWYGGRQLTCIFVNIESWKAAICGLFFRKRCPKGKSCNFLHVFQNPGREFYEADYDWRLNDRTDRSERQASSIRDSRRGDSRYSNRRSRSRSRSPSRSFSRKYSRQRSRSRSRSKSRLSSRSSHRRSRSRSPSRRYSSRRRSRSKSFEGSSRHSSSLSHDTNSTKSHKEKRKKHRSRSSSRDRYHRRKRSKSISPNSNSQTDNNGKSYSKKKKPSKNIDSPSPPFSHNSDLESKQNSAYSQKKLSPVRANSKNSTKNPSDSSSSSDTSSSSSEEEEVYEFVEKTKETLSKHR